MSDKKTLKLVEGIFTVEDASDILFHLVEKKINFHQCRMLSNYERYGTEDAYSKNRIKELKETLLSLKDILHTARLSGMHLQVRSEILLSLTEDPATSKPGAKQERVMLN